MNKKTINLLKKTARPLGSLLSILSLLFIAWAIYKLGFDFGTVDNIPVFIAIGACGVLIKCISVLIAGSAWADWLFFLAPHAEKNRKGAISAYVKANIGKYLPGNVMHYVERNLFASGLGIGQRKIALASIAEILGQVGGALITALIMSRHYLMLALNRVFDGNYTVPAVVLAAAAVCCAAVLFLFRNSIIDFLSGCSVLQLLKIFITTIIKYILSLWLLGVVMVLLFIYMGGKGSIENINLIISAYVIAWVLGFVTPGASGGIGVREIVIIFLLSSIVGEELIITLSVIHRLITIIGDFLIYFCVLGINRIRNKKGENTI